MWQSHKKKGHLTCTCDNIVSHKHHFVHTDGQRTLTHDKSSPGLWPGELKKPDSYTRTIRDQPFKLKGAMVFYSDTTKPYSLFFGAYDYTVKMASQDLFFLLSSQIIFLHLLVNK